MVSIPAYEQPNPEPQRPPEEQARKADRRRKLSRAAIIAVIAASVGLVALVASLTWGLPLGRSLEPMSSPTLVLVSSDGKAFARRGSYKEEPVDAAKLPDHVRLAFVAIEDRRFYRHMGVDVRAVGRAVMRNMRSGGISQGGSTITQQLAKNAFTTGKRTYRRKAREALIALYLEARLSKNEILSRYLSSVYFGDGVFGLKGAAKHYFNKQPEQLSVGEAAMLAGLVKAPTKLAPTDNPEAATDRARVVLGAMADMGVITDAQARAAGRSIKIREGRPALPIGSYFADYVSPFAKTAFDRSYGEVKVTTTLDSALQARAERALQQALSAGGARLNASQGAVVAMRTDGAILAMVGGKNYKESQFNRAVQAERQPGSAFKPFVYLAALRRGATPSSLVSDAPIKVGGWSPQNHESNYSNGPITLREAFAKSSNVAAVRLAQETGIPAIHRVAEEMGLHGKMPEDLTMALGSGSVTLLDLTAAYAGIAAGAAPVTPYGLAAEPSPPPTRRLGRFEHQGILEMMRAVVTNGTGAAANVGAPAFGKTGTSQDYRDAWFVGFVGDVVVGVWIGNDDNTPMKRSTGGMLPAQIWHDVMGYALSKGAVHNVPRPQAPVVETPYADAPEGGLPPDGSVFADTPVPQAAAEDDGFLRLPPPRRPRSNAADPDSPDIEAPPPIPQARRRFEPPPTIDDERPPPNDGGGENDFPPAAG